MNIDGTTMIFFSRGFLQGLRSLKHGLLKDKVGKVSVTKLAILGQFFEVSLHKFTNFRDISGCQWTVPSDLFSKKKSHKFFLHLLALVSKFHNDLLTSPSEKKIILKVFKL